MVQVSERTRLHRLIACAGRHALGRDFWRWFADLAGMIRKDARLWPWGKAIAPVGSENSIADEVVDLPIGLTTLIASCLVSSLRCCGVWEPRSNRAVASCWRTSHYVIHIIEFTVHGLSTKQMILICVPHSDVGMGADSKNFPVNFAQ